MRDDEASTNPAPQVGLSNLIVRATVIAAADLAIGIGLWAIFGLTILSAVLFAFAATIVASTILGKDRPHD